jgi:scyllo-inositol 2-dehydrogenase (NADP+)
MRVVVAGMGVQGRKRKRFAAGDYVCSVDPAGEEADHKSLRDVPVNRYDAVLA